LIARAWLLLLLTAAAMGGILDHNSCDLVL